MLKTKLDYNPILNDANFLKIFQSRSIQLIAPASSTDPEIIEQLRTIAHLKISIPENILEKKLYFMQIPMKKDYYN